MSKLLTHALLLTGVAALACAPAATVRTSGQATGAPSSRHAVEQFMGAVRAGDIQAMTVVWGTSRGPSRDTMERTELERRAIILQCFLAHDQFRILSDYPGDGGRRMVRGTLTRGAQSRETAFTTVQGPGERWYVEAVDMSVMRDWCTDASATGTR